MSSVSAVPRSGSWPCGKGDRSPVSPCGRPSIPMAGMPGWPSAVLDDVMPAERDADAFLSGRAAWAAARLRAGQRSKDLTAGVIRFPRDGLGDMLRMVPLLRSAEEDRRTTATASIPLRATEEGDHPKGGGGGGPAAIAQDPSRAHRANGISVGALPVIGAAGRRAAGPAAGAVGPRRSTSWTSGRHPRGTRSRRPARRRRGWCRPRRLRP